MKTMIKRVAFLTVLAALLGLMSATAWAAEANEIDPSLVFASETQLNVYVDGEWNAGLSDRHGFGDTVTVTAPDVSGKTFSHWEADGSTVSYSNPLKLTVNAHTTLYAVYASAAPTAQATAGFTSVTRTNDGTKISFQAIADPNGETVEGAGIVYSTTVSGEALKLNGADVVNAAAEQLTDSTTTMPDSVRDDNNCWILQITPEDADTVYHARAYVTAGGNTTYGDVKDVKLSELESGVSLIANVEGMNPEDKLEDVLQALTDEVCTVTFDANGGKGSMEPQSVVKNKSTALSANTFTREGYSFTGWSTTANGSVSYTDGQSVTLSGDTTLYAQWKSNAGPLHIHTWGEWTVTKEATCVAKGQETHTCSGCGKVETRDIDVNPKNHTGKTQVKGKKKATTTAKGYTGDTYCKDCGKKLKSGKAIPKLTPETVSYKDLSKAEKQSADAVSKALGVNKDTAAKMVAEAKRLGVSMDTVKLSGSALAKANVDSADPKGSSFGRLSARAVKRTKNALTLQWRKQKNADGYLVYGNLCGKGKKLKLVKTITKNGTIRFTQKKLKKGKYYKYIVVAYKNVNGKKMPIAASVVIHVPTKGGKTTVAKALKITNAKKKVITKAAVKKGQSLQLKAVEVKAEKKKKVKAHRKVKFESSDRAIVAVNAKGRITGRKKGKATVYAYAQNGICKAIRVTVK